MRAETAETLALQALGWLAGIDEAVDRFLALSGLSATELRDRAEDPELLAAVVDFILSEDSLARNFCETAGIDALTLHACRRALPGASEH